jgi:hypothetical protein
VAVQLLDFLWAPFVLLGIEKMRFVPGITATNALDLYQGADDPTLFLLYTEWRDKACFEAHIATPHVKHAEDCLKREKMLIEPAKE